MKKLVALLFLFLICLTTLSGTSVIWETGYDLPTDNEECQKENKESKKETKEFIACVNKNIIVPLLQDYIYRSYQAIIFQKPSLAKSTPPPDLSC